MKYASLTFITKWLNRFRPNDEFRITAGDMQEFSRDVADSFGDAAPNVPLLDPARDYTQGYQVRAVYDGVSYLFFSRNGGAHPAPPDYLGDGNWGPVAPQVPATQLSQRYPLGYAQYVLSAHPEAIKLGLLYLVPGLWNNTPPGQLATFDEELVEVEGGQMGFARLGTVRTYTGERLPVTVDVAAGTYSADLGGGGGALPAASPTTRGGVRVGQALAVAGDVLSLQFDSGTLGINQNGEVYVLATSGNISPAATPTNFRAHFKGGNSGQRLDWDAMPGATIYEVFRSTQGGPFGLLGNVPYPYFTDTNDQQGAYVVYAVNSANGAGQSARAVTQCT